MADRQARRPPRHASSRRGKGGGFPPPPASDRPIQQTRHDPLPAPFPSAPPPPHHPPFQPPHHEMRGQYEQEVFRPPAAEGSFRSPHHVKVGEMIPPLPPYLMNMSSPMTADPSHFSPFSPLTPESIRQAREQDFYASHLPPFPPGFHPMPHPPPFSHPHGPFDPPFRYPPTESHGPMRHLPPPSLPPSSHYEHARLHTEEQSGGAPKPLRLAVPGVQPAPLSDSPSNEQIRSIEREISRLLFSPTSSDEQLERDAPLPPPEPPLATLPSPPPEARPITSNLFVVEKKLREPGPDFFIALNEQIHQLISEMEPHEEEYARWQEVVTETRRVVQDCFPDALLHQFGSTANGLSTRSADIDLCLSFPSDSPHYAMPAAETVQQLGDYLKAKARAISGEPEEGDAPQLASEQHFPTLEANARPKKSEEEAPRPRWRFSDFKVLTRTRIPIVKFKDALSGCQIDIGCNNLLAVENTRLLKAYTLIDDRFRQAALVIKHWTKQRGIADTYNGTLSSYAYNLMLIHYLQWRCYPAVLPNLQALGEKVPADRAKHPLLDPYNTTFLEDMSALPRLWPQNGQNRQNVAELVYGFFVYYAFEFEFKDWVASIRLGRAILKVEKGWFGMKSDRESAPAPDATAIVAHEEEANLKGEEVKPKEEEEEEVEELSAEEKQKAATERFFKRQRFWFCVEDPFEVEHNLGRVVDRNGLYLVRGEFITAVNFLASFAPRSSPGQPLQKPRIFGQYPPPHYIGVLKRLCRHWEDEKDAHARSVNRQKIQQQYDTFTTSEPGKGEKPKNARASGEGAKEDPDVFEHGRDRRDISRAVRERKDRSGHFSHRQGRPKSEGEKGRKHVK